MATSQPKFLSVYFKHKHLADRIPSHTMNLMQGVPCEPQLRDRVFNISDLKMRSDLA